MHFTVVTTNSDSYVMFCLQSYQGLIFDRYIDLRQLKWSVQFKTLLNNCKQNITSLSLLAGTTVPNR